MTGIAGMDSMHSRIASIESRLGVGGNRGVDTRAATSASFDAVLQGALGSVTPGSTGGTSTRSTSTVPTSWNGGVGSMSPTAAIEQIAEQLGIDLSGTGGIGNLPSTTGTGSLAGVPYADLFEAAGAAHGVDPALLAAVAGVESGYDPTAVSHAGARGLMQLMPGTASGLGVTDSFDPSQAVDGAARLLSGHLDRFGSVELALAAYNAGPGAVTRFGGIPPYAETQAYVPKVLARYQELSR